MKKSFFYTLQLVVILNCATCLADIFRLEEEGGVVSFTDTPQNNRYSLIIREHRSRHQHIPKKRAAMHPSTAPKNASDSAPTLNPDVGSLPIQGVITSPVGMRFDPFDGKLRHHNGIDIAAPSGTPVKPIAKGTVIFSGWRSGYGNTVIVDHHNGMMTVYAHHSRNLVSEGTPVDSSTVIALSGSTGRSTGPHLHFEAWQDGNNITASFMPANYLGKNRPVIAAAPIHRILQEDGTILFTNLK